MRRSAFISGVLPVCLAIVALGCGDSDRPKTAPGAGGVGGSSDEGGAAGSSASSSDGGTEGDSGGQGANEGGEPGVGGAGGGSDGCTIDGDACDDGLACNGADTCSAGACTIHEGSPCDDGQACSESAGGPSCEDCLLYVQPDGDDANSGASWDDAVATVSKALELSSAHGCEIWAAAGEYLPVAPPDAASPRLATFHLALGVHLYGGFAGSETSRGERDFETNLTVLSGDIGVPDSASDNSYHVVTSSADTTLDGFWVSGGNANGSAAADQYGGGMKNDTVSPTVANCTFVANQATIAGGAMFNDDGASPTLTNCTFSDNAAGVGGGAIYNRDGSSPQVSECTFLDNAADSGAGVFNENSSPTITGCTFSGNVADIGRGGGIYNKNSHGVVSDSTFTGNSAVTGGGMRNDASSTRVTRCVFSENVADWGGGIHNGQSASPTITSSTFDGNSASLKGGGVASTGAATTTIVNSVFFDNDSESGGGLVIRNASASVINCAVSANLSTTAGAGILAETTSTLTVANSIVYGNAAQNPGTGNDILIGSTAVATFSHSDLGQACGSFGSVTCGEGNLSTDPLFVDSANGDLALQAGSPCRNAGSDASLPNDLADLDQDGELEEPLPLDRSGNTRVLGASVDMGAFEATE